MRLSFRVKLKLKRAWCRVFGHRLEQVIGRVQYNDVDEWGVSDLCRRCARQIGWGVQVVNTVLDGPIRISGHGVYVYGCTILEDA